MSRDTEVTRVAAKYIRQRGAQSVRWLLDMAQLAEDQGHRDMAAVWREIAAAGDTLLQGPSDPKRRPHKPR
jgi:hypothetical protein